MVKYSGSVVVPYARERVFALMSDWTNVCVWDTNISQSTLASTSSSGATQKAGQVGEGTRYDCAFKVAGKQLAVDYECVKFDAPRYCEYSGTASLFTSRDWLQFKDAPALKASGDDGTSSMVAAATTTTTTAAAAEGTEGGGKKEEATEITAEFNLAFRGVLNPLSFTLNSAMQKTGPTVMTEIEKFVHDKLGSSGIANSNDITS